MTIPATFSLFSTDLAAIVDRVGRSVVTVRSGHGAASGTVLAPGRIVMANHGLDPDAETAQVVFGDSAHEVRIAGRDTSADLAVVVGDPEILTPPAIASGQTVPAVGVPLVSVGRAWTRLVAGFGIVHAHEGPFHRRPMGRLETLLRTTITPYPGYSGGPLVDASGQMVALCTAGLHRGAGLGVPVSLVLQRVEALATHGRIRRGFVGVTSMNVDLPEAQRGPSGERTGLLVTSIAPEGPAARSGMLVGDVLVRLDDQPLGSPEELQSFLSGDVIGRVVALTIVRGTQSSSLDLTIGERSAASR